MCNYLLNIIQICIIYDHLLHCDIPDSNQQKITQICMKRVHLQIQLYIQPLIWMVFASSIHQPNQFQYEFLNRASSWITSQLTIFQGMRSSINPVVQITLDQHDSKVVKYLNRMSYLSGDANELFNCNCRWSTFIKWCYWWH